MQSGTERVDRCADFDRHQRKEIGLTTLPVQFGAGLVARFFAVACEYVDGRNTRMGVLRICMNSVCRHN
jgi:hypothetical protein